MNSHSNEVRVIGTGKWDKSGWENVHDVADVIGVRPASIIRWYCRDEDWPCGPVMRPARKDGSRAASDFSDYWLPPGSLDLIADIYPKRTDSTHSAMQRRSKEEVDVDPHTRLKMIEDQVSEIFKERARLMDDIRKESFKSP